MSRPAIIVDDLSKSYRIGAEAKAYPTFREALAETAKALFRRLREWDGGGVDGETFWALKDVSFEVQPGEVIGIIGRNGAGKSTLLKILSRITEPSAGSIRLRGRVASLLEVGTGFHPELTGRENIYLNGSILGMKKAEIDRKFDEIVEFAGVGRFLDTPVKRYSSGMFVRLAFSVAAHLEPEILIVDEVLAVGDAEFQKKCIGKMRDVSQGHGRTVLFVSHNMNAVSQLCQKAIMLRQGELVMHGPALPVMQAYSRQASSNHAADLFDHHNRSLSMNKIFRYIELIDQSGRPAQVFSPRSQMHVRLGLNSEISVIAPRLAIAINNWRGERVFTVATYLSRSILPTIRGEQVIRARFELPALLPGRYTVDISLADSSERHLDEIHSAISLDISNVNYLETTTMPFPMMGLVMVRSEWHRES